MNLHDMLKGKTTSDGKIDFYDHIFRVKKEAKALLDEIPEIIQNFRQTVLAAACSGKLTKDWRKVNPNVALSGSIVASPAQNYLLGLPATWTITSIDQGGIVKGGKRLPKGDMLVEYDTGYPYIKAGNLKNGTVITDQMEFLTPQSQKRIKNYTVSGGDVYITIVGAYIGDAGVIPDELDGANLTENAAKICNLVNCNNRYLAFWLRSEKSQTIIRDRISSATQGKLALFRIKSLPVPLPPLPEQQEIVRRVESLFSKAGDLEAQYKEAIDNIESLPEIILSKAFRGELLPQDPNDEPASVLLKRIIESLDKEEPIEIQRKSFGLDARNMMNYKEMIA
jgi:type I restriction enzyme, S subunit